MRINGLCTECVHLTGARIPNEIYSFYRADKIDAQSVSNIDLTPNRTIIFDLSNLLQSLLLLSKHFEAFRQSSKFEH